MGWWLARSESDVKADMAMYKQNADEGKGNYGQRCLGA